MTASRFSLTHWSPPLSLSGDPVSFSSYCAHPCCNNSSNHVSICLQPLGVPYQSRRYVPASMEFSFQFRFHSPAQRDQSRRILFIKFWHFSRVKLDWNDARFPLPSSFHRGWFFDSAQNSHLPQRLRGEANWTWAVQALQLILHLQVEL